MRSARHVVVDRTPFTIGRRSDNDLRLAGSDEEITEKSLKHGGVMRLGRGGGAEIEMVFRTEE